MSEKNKRTLKVYNFDIDDNIVRAKTRIHGFIKRNNDIDYSNCGPEELEKHIIEGNLDAVSFTTEEFAIARNYTDKYYFDYASAFLDFGDNGVMGDQSFSIDMREALKSKNFSPSWNDFLECIKGGNLFSLITARGHASKTLRQLPEMIIYNDDISQFGLTDSEREELVLFLRNFHEGSDDEVISKYLDDCSFMGISSSDFAVEFLEGDTSKMLEPEKYKKMFLKKFFTKCYNISQKYDLRLEFSLSDDDIVNIEGVHDLFKQLKEMYPEVVFNVYDTSGGREKIRL